MHVTCEAQITCLRRFLIR